VSSHNKDITSLRERNDELQEQVLQLKKALVPEKQFPLDWKLEPGEHRLLMCLTSALNGFRTRDTLWIAYTDCWSLKDSNPRTLDVRISRLRHKLPPGVTIKGFDGGFQLRGKEIMLKALEEETPIQECEAMVRVVGLEKKPSGLYQIEKGIPLPSGCKSCLYPLKDMEVGDSFLVEGGVDKNIRGSISNWKKKRPEMKFAVRNVEGGVRVWRVA